MGATTYSYLKRTVYDKLLKPWQSFWITLYYCTKKKFLCSANRTARLSCFCSQIWSPDLEIYVFLHTFSDVVYNTYVSGKTATLIFRGRQWSLSRDTLIQSTTPHTTSCKYNRLTSHLLWSFTSDFFSPISVTCLSCLMLLELIIPTIFGEKKKKRVSIIRISSTAC